MFKAHIGDLFTSGAQTLVNTVNCVGVMGKGVALAFKQKYPGMYEDYLHRCEQKAVKLGEPYLYEDLGGLKILNFPTKNHWRSPSRLEDIERGLDFLAANADGWGITSMAMPPLGCGNGGLEWAEVGPLIHVKLAHLPIDIEVFAPYGTPKNQLTESFLAAPTQMTLDSRGRKQEKLNPEWVVLLEVLRELGDQPYANPVGRVIFQKICYVLTEMGLKTGFKFDKGSYGPFAGEVKDALHDFANRNWVQEKPLGKMMALKVEPQYALDRGKYLEVINQHQKRISKTVDLFSRIKSTDQAEEVVTVLFSSRQLKKESNSDEVTEQELFDYILDWKKRWGSNEKRESLANTIRNLVLLGWMRLSYSESLMEA